MASAWKLSKIDESLRSEHSHLKPDDVCYFFGEYLPRQGYGGSQVNQLIFNLKKAVANKGQTDYRYKAQAITEMARRLSAVFSNPNNSAVVASLTFVPIPPSKSRSDPGYDDRLLQVLQQVVPALDIQELVVRRISTKAHHDFKDGESRPTIEDLKQSLELATSKDTPPRQRIMLFDDIITNGTHFRACKELILDAFSDRRVDGMFIGRAKRPSVFDMF
jgi:predicted amidophosphoribosyltransferase